ncbi:TPA: IS66 family insertion sequence element accessory protein TnpB [Citrobacter werkmanii]|nr:IS66 family insertion sequence element accessory protein TnpB [Citrobacter werkmanii]
MITLPTGTRIRIIAGVTDMRCGFNGLASKVQNTLKDDPFSGHIFVFRGRSGKMVKILWADRDGLCLFAKRLERGRFVWPVTREGKVHLTLPPAKRFRQNSPVTDGLSPHQKPNVPSAAVN